MKKTCGIYKITNTKNGKFYIGSSKSIQARWYKHKSQLKHNRHENAHLQRSWNKYGSESFTLEIVEEVDFSIILKKEQYYLDSLKPFSPYGFNIGKQASGGDNLTNHPRRKEIIEKMREGVIRRYQNLTPEEKKKISENMTGNKNPNFGNKWNKKQRNKASKRMKLNPPSNETVQKMIEGSKKAWKDPEYKKKQIENRTGKGNSFYGKHHSNKTKSALSRKSLKKFKQATPEEKYNKNPQIRKVEINGETYFGVSEAARQLKVCPATILHRIKSPNVKFKDYHYLD